MVGGVSIFPDTIDDVRQRYEAPTATATDAAIYGSRLQMTGRLAEAIAVMRHGVERDPGHAVCHSNLIFTMDMDPSVTLEEAQAERRRWYERHGAPWAWTGTPHYNDSDPERPLRVGYVSADFRLHSAAMIFGQVVMRHSPMVEVHCYSMTQDADPTWHLFRERSRVWRRIVERPDDVVEQAIRRDRIDILVDLSSHTAGNRLSLFARKPAPVQITAWGYATGTGIPQIDYFLADAVAVRPNERPLYAEEVVEMPCLVCFDAAHAPAPGRAPVIGNGHVTFGSLNRVAKLTDPTLALWSRIMTLHPSARLLVKDQSFDDPGIMADFRKRAETAGLPLDRIDIEGRTDRVNHVATNRRIDIALDPMPHGGGITTLESLSVGVPVVTLAGGTVPSRVSASILAAIGLGQLATATEDAYVEAVGWLAEDPARLDGLRQLIPGAFRASPVGDVDRYAAMVEDVYRQMWRRWCGRRLMQ